MIRPDKNQIIVIYEQDFTLGDNHPFFVGDNARANSYFLCIQSSSTNLILKVNKLTSCSETIWEYLYELRSQKDRHRDFILFDFGEIVLKRYCKVVNRSFDIQIQSVLLFEAKQNLCSKNSVKSHFCVLLFKACFYSRLYGMLDRLI